MAGRRSLPDQQPSSELGAGDFAITHNARTGRPIRKRRKTHQAEASPFVDSAIAVSDPDEILEDDYDNVDLDNNNGNHDRRRNGRTSRGGRVSKGGKPSAAANDDDDDVVRVPALRVPRSKKRRLELSPELSDGPELDEEIASTGERVADLGFELDGYYAHDELDHADDEHEDEEGKNGDDSIAVAASKSRSIVLKDVVINVPPGHQGPIVLEIGNPSLAGRNPRGMVNTSIALSSNLPRVANRSNRLSGGKPHAKPTTTSSKSKSKSKPTPSSTKPKKPTAGFLDLAPELRNQIYRLALVQRNQTNSSNNLHSSSSSSSSSSSANHRADIRFDNPDNFSRSAALLRTNRQVHAEAASILYGENRFVLKRRATRYGSYWTADWAEMGFKAVRKFLKTIGPVNTGLIRHVTLLLEDASPTANSALRTVEQRRFVNDEVLLSVLRHLADWGRLETLRLSFKEMASTGRRRVDRTDVRFLDHLFEISADEVLWEPYFTGLPPYVPAVKQESALGLLCVGNMTRKAKLYSRKDKDEEEEEEEEE